MISRSSFGALLLAACALAAPAPAATIVGNAYNGLAALRELSVFTRGDLTSGHDIEGKAFVGGNLYGSSQVGIGSHANAAQGFRASSLATLTVVGDTTGGIKVNNGSNGASGTLVDNGAATRARVGGTAGNLGLNDLPASGAALAQVGGDFNNQNFNPNAAKIVRYGGTASNVQAQDAAYVKQDASLGGGKLQAALAAERDQMYADFASLSTQLAKLATTSQVAITEGGNRVTFDAVADASGQYAVFSIADGASFFANQNGTIYFNIPKLTDGSYLTTVINVYGTAIVDKLNSNNSLYNPYVLWNFVDATSIDFQRQVNGSVLATRATLSNSTPIEGSVVADTFHQNGEVHLGTYGGVSTFATVTPAATPAVPEPATWATMVLGFGAIGYAARRRRRRQAAAA